MFYIMLVATMCYLALIATLYTKLCQWADKRSKLTRIVCKLAGLSVSAGGPVFWSILRPTRIDEQMNIFILAAGLLGIALIIAIAMQIRKDMLSQKLTFKQWLRQEF
ncbi:hypothetical protein OPS25_13890 [Alteromonas ponticola]|uniref:Uncharacterized protein n=1 Tax=Alteromonas aquimaris TaxID=2998417 RepID=A0ABT3P9Z1_9ALTE|nr:hypothetical protein [Alteromonas aquimaris]MCW8109596.1 hypothetical protein [Alteromonas aquimaris]